ncbi:hypothetical protein N7462_010860 [Penicillium macrosclerotiorum]|uniref:uncharacterized protein n=1 Tax=Penicillium macrosclerotiorum TaxID=303699 RepID=UPI002548EB50|nr:uncharacterized protein N7462_010860 [Penicillium macrosclerotiorum]KAJ5669790.1 hypothetical protein N7462_010860 [Penicillium macrosclerotiorum]
MADMDGFAQTRGADDLFDDEIIPVSAEEQQAQTEVVVIPEADPEPVPQAQGPVIEQQPFPRGDTPQRGRGGDRGRGRGRGGARGKGGRGLQESQWAEKKPAESAPRNKAPKASIEPKVPATEAVTPDKPQDSAKDQAAQEEDAKGEVQPTNGAEPQRVPAVRGDRSATGGVRKPKLTEEELSKRIAAAKENAAKKAAAHARAEADQASFLEREQVAAEKRRQEAANRKVMDNEREQNRQRKLRAQTGREWDSQKQEEDYNPRGGGSQFRRGMHGGVTGYARRDFDEGRSDESGPHASTGRGRGRGGRGGRGRGLSRGPQGDRAASNEPSERGGPKASTPAVNSQAEFPSLPAGKKPEDTAPATLETKATRSPPSMEKLESSMSPLTGTWADQVEE